jgi:hypothetical protein
MKLPFFDLLPPESTPSERAVESQQKEHRKAGIQNQVKGLIK